MDGDEAFDLELRKKKPVKVSKHGARNRREIRGRRGEKEERKSLKGNEGGETAVTGRDTLRLSRSLNTPPART